MRDTGAPGLPPLRGLLAPAAGPLPGPADRPPRGARCASARGAPAHTRARGSSPAELLVQRLLDGRVDELRHVAAEARHFAHQTRREVREIERGNERSEEHTSELQSLTNLVCRLLLEKKKKKNNRKNDHKHHIQRHDSLVLR